jgi:hypothetical protein
VMDHTTKTDTSFGVAFIVRASPPIHYRGGPLNASTRRR